MDPNQESASASASASSTTETSTATTGSAEKNLLDPDVEAKGAKEVLDALTKEERSSLMDDDMPMRHFRAEKGDVAAAIRQLKETLRWRKEFGVEDVRDCFAKSDEAVKDMMSLENETGKIYVRGYDCDGRATLYMRPQRENTKHELNNMKHLVYNLERAVACTKRKSSGKLHKINLMIDYDGFRLRDSPPLSTSRYTLDILQKHYPETMYRAYVCNPPFSFRAFWTIIKPFLDPVTKEKIVFCHGKDGIEQIKKRYSLDDVEKCGGGVDGKNVEPFNSQEYLRRIPFDVAFGETAD